MILAAVDLLATERGLDLVRFFTASVATVVPLLIVNGPIAKEINVNSSFDFKDAAVITTVTDPDGRQYQVKVAHCPGIAKS